MKTLTLFFMFVLAASVADAQWVQTNGPYGGQITALLATGANLFAGTDSGGVYRSTNNGGNWTAVSAGLPHASNDTAAIVGVQAFAVSGPNLFAGTELGVFLSTNNGTSWSAVNKGLPHSVYDTTSIDRILAFAVRDTNLFVGTASDGVYLSTNNGKNWSAANTDLPKNTSGGIWVDALAVKDSSLFAGAWGSGVFLSTNNGKGWSAVNSGFREYKFVTCIATSGANLFAGWGYEGGMTGRAGGGCFLSKNYGKNWIDASAGLQDPSYNVVNTLIVSPLYDEATGLHLFAGTKHGVYLSINTGTSWTASNDGLPDDRAIRCLVICDTLVFAGTSSGESTKMNSTNTSVQSRGSYPGRVWRRSLVDLITAVKHSVEIPGQFLLHQNYPNPFNPSTTIRYGLPNRSQVTLSVYNTLGQQVAELVNGDMEAGYHEVRFDAVGLSSGVYFYRLQAGSFVETRKLLLVR